jgi:hypothetical protein
MKNVFMKAKIFSAILVAGSLVACKKGDLGPQGPQGQQGQQGPQGTPGSAAVQYSAWLEVNDASWVQTGIEETDGSYWNYGGGGGWLAGTDTTITYRAEVATPKVTQQVLDSGIVLYYFKDSSDLYKGSVRNFNVYDAYNDWYNVGTINRTKEDVENNYMAGFWVRTDADTIPKQKLALYTYWQGGTKFYDPRSVYDYGYLEFKQKYTDLKPKTKFYIRYIIIPGGSATGGRIARLPVDVKNYEAVKTFYKISD